MHSKPNLLSWACGERKYRVYYRVPSEESGQLILKRLELPSDFQKRILNIMLEVRVCRMCNQLMDFLLIGQWWGSRVVFWKSLSSTFCFQGVCGPCVCGEHAVTTLHLNEGLKFLQNSSKMCIRLLCLSLQERLGLYFIIELLFKLSLLFLLTAFLFVFFLHFLSSLISNCLSLLFRIQGRPKRQSLFLQKRNGKHRWVCHQEALHGSFMVSVFTY